MYRFSTLVLSLSFLAGCPEHPTTLPVPAPTAMLAPGAYRVTVDSTNRWNCGGSRVSDVVGTGLTLELMVKNGRAAGNLNGVRMSGEAAPGFVYLDGQVEVGPVVYEDDIAVEQGDDDVDSDESVESDGGDRSNGRSKSGETQVDCGDDSVSSDDRDEDSSKPHEGEDEDGCVEDPVEPHDPQQPEQIESQVSLDLEVLNQHLASGILVIAVPECKGELNVTAKWIHALEPRNGAVPVPDEPRPGKEEQGGCGEDSGEETDCG